MTHSAEDIHKQFQREFTVGASKGQSSSGIRRAISPGEVKKNTLISPVRPHSQTSNPLQQAGVRYITEDLIRKISKESNLDLVTSLNLTLSKEGGKKIKYIENLDRLRKLQTLNLSYNIIEKMENLDKLLRLQDLNLSNNMITKIEGIENMSSLQILNLNDNLIEHIPQWFCKKLKALRTFKIARNKIKSLSEIAKLKPLPDLIQLDVTGNHLISLPYYRLYIIFHLRTVETLDSQHVHDKERKQAQERFSNDEVILLEKKLEEEEFKYRQLQDSHSKSLQEKSLQETSQHQLESKERNLRDKLKQLEEELAAKDELLKRKTSDLNKASQKHYQLEQELAFYKIDSKFDTLKEAPNLHLESADESSDFQESPYIGRARFRVNKYAQETDISVRPQKAHMINIGKSFSDNQAFQHSQEEHTKTDVEKELNKKQKELQKTEEKLKALQSDQWKTESMLRNATTALKKIATDRFTPESFQVDNKYKLPQILTKKMQKVNELRDTATQMESEIDRTQAILVKNTNGLQKLKSQLAAMDINSPLHASKEKDIVEKESQVNRMKEKMNKLQQELENSKNALAQETADIKNLEEALSTDQNEKNVEIHHELDDIITGLTVYLENVKSESQNYKQEAQMLIQEKNSMKDKIQHMESDIVKLEIETKNSKIMQRRLGELEDSLHRTEEAKADAELRSSKNQELQNRLDRAENEAKQLKQIIKENQIKMEADRKLMQNQLKMERERADKMTQKIQDVKQQKLETKNILSQLESAKALNAGLKDQVEEFKQIQQTEESSFRPSELKSKLTKFTHEFKTNKNLIQPESKNDVLGLAFQEVQKHAQEQMNSSIMEIEKLKKYNEKIEEENKKLVSELNLLKNNLEKDKSKKKGGNPVSIVYRPDPESESGGDKASSLNSDEKQLFDELQQELLELKRFMRLHESHLSKKVLEAETEAHHWKDEMNQKEKHFESEIEEYRQLAELMREKQEARIQVIAQDLDQAQFVADALQSLLETKEKALSEEFSTSGIKNQMISAQEEELVKLYDILEKQRDEIENLNQMLDHLAQQGPDGVGIGFDDELWHIRQEVNNLKETLAMQSAYVQAMPSVGHIEVQTNSQDASDNHPRNETHIFMPRNIAKTNGTRKLSRSQPASVASTHHSSLKPHSGASTTTYSGRTYDTSKQIYAPLGTASVPSFSFPQNISIKDSHKYIQEHLGTERKESKDWHVAKSSLNRQSTPTGNQPSNLGRQSTPIGDQPSNLGRQSTPIGNQPSNQGRQSMLTFSQTSSHDRQNTQVDSQPLPLKPLEMASPNVPVLQTDVRKELTTESLAYQPIFQSNLATPVTIPSNSEDASGNVPSYLPGGRTFSPQKQVDGAPFNQRPVTFITNQAEVRHPQSQVEPRERPQSAPSIDVFTHNDVYPDEYPQALLVGGTMPTIPSVLLPSGMDGHQTLRTTSGSIPVQVGAGAYHPQHLFTPTRQTRSRPVLGEASLSPSPAGKNHGVDRTVVTLTPLASDTPAFSESSTAAYIDQSSTLAQGPVRSYQMDNHPKSILKERSIHQTIPEDSHLFCNVPEHHELEDYIVELQERKRLLELRIEKKENQRDNAKFHKERNSVKQLLNELEDRREELEGLDLAIERQTKSVREMKREETDLRRERKEAHSQLDFLRKHNDHKRRHLIEKQQFEDTIERSKLLYLMDELKCVERSLAKRNGQLRDTERKLKECNIDLKHAKEQKKETLRQYDVVTNNMHETLNEQQEIEKRSNDLAVELVKATEQLTNLKADIMGLERRKYKQDKLLREINDIIAKKDGEFNELDTKVKTASDKLQRLQADCLINTERERAMVQSLHDSEEVLTKRRSEIKKLKDQQVRIASGTTQKVQQSKQELERLDQEIGRKKTDLQILQETHERKEQELTNVLHEAESEIASKHRMIKDCRDDVENLNIQKQDLNAHIKTKKLELQQIKEEIEQEEEVLQRLFNNVTKNKAELKHTLEMQTIEQTELENIKVQQAQKLSELDRTQRALQEEKHDLEQLTAEASRKSADLERLKQAVERDRLEVDQLNNEKHTLDDRLLVLTRERDILHENCKSLDENLKAMKRNQIIMQEKITLANSRTEMVEAEMRMKEREMENVESQNQAVEKEVQAIKMTLIEKKQELQIFQDKIQEAEDELKVIDRDVRTMSHHRDEAKLELDHLNHQIHLSHINLEEHMKQEKTKYNELQELLRTLADREKEHHDICMILNKSKYEVEMEETHLKKMVSSSNTELMLVKDEIRVKNEELTFLKSEFSQLQSTMDELQTIKEKCTDLNKTCQGLEENVRMQTNETSDLTRALTVSNQEIEELQEENSQIREKLIKERVEFENTLKDLHGNLELTKQEIKNVEQRSSNQVAQLQTLAEKHFNRANLLESELTQAKKELYLGKQSDNKENVTDVFVVPSDSNQVTNKYQNDDHLMKDSLRKRLTEEQEYFRFQLKQQILRHSETMESARIKSEETIECLRNKLNTLQQILFESNPTKRPWSEEVRKDPSYLKKRNNQNINTMTRRTRSSENISLADIDYHSHF
ncbi:centriolin-like isoform X5 [Biomphalaria glabrata]|uniref:Centriolin-like isoform X5 n=1 Tax=Biomphalaria glabrata TaxID=6526 RepID=A0A9W3BBJ0_BIOGL|nr:centriolin-like isoform X5 [Biomphalaria glabrata]